MPKLVTINAPVKNGGITQVSGYVVLLYVGNYREKFLLQQTNTREVFLTHYASGQKLGSLTPIKLRCVMQGAPSLNDRSAAIELIDDLIRKHGTGKVQQIINSAPKIN